MRKFHRAQPLPAVALRRIALKPHVIHSPPQYF
jgi:hypothetical protein